MVESYNVQSPRSYIYDHNKATQDCLKINKLEVFSGIKTLPYSKREYDV